MAKKKTELGMTEELRRLKHAAPFVSFRIKTSGGDTFTVEESEHFMISPRGDTAIFYPVEEPGHHVLDVRHVASLEPVRNRSRKPRRR
jgi:hypothetical protein